MDDFTNNNQNNTSENQTGRMNDPENGRVRNVYTVGGTPAGEAQGTDTEQPSSARPEMPAGYSADFRTSGSYTAGAGQEQQEQKRYTGQENERAYYHNGYNGNSYTYSSYTPPYDQGSNTKKASRHGKGGLIALGIAAMLVFSLVMAAVGAGVAYSILAHDTGDTPVVSGDASGEQDPNAGSSDRPTLSTTKPNEEKNPVVIHKNNGTTVITTAGSIGDENLSIADVAALVRDSVVEITTNYVVSGSMFSQYVSSGAGSGVIIAQEGRVGYIVTNNHVIEGATSIMVRLTDGKEMDATLVGADSETDIAVLTVTSDENLTVATLGDSDALVVGQEVIAIGNPLGELGGTVTNGIISALARQVQIGGEKMTLLQTNAAVNPGNSGGGLFNMRGELIGVVNAKSSGDDVEGLGFAIPVNTAFNTITELIEYGYVRNRPALGITIQEARQQYFVYYYTCVYVTDPGKTELKKNDIITEIEGTSISSTDDISAAISGKAVGDTVEIKVIRNNEELTVKVTLVEYVPQ